MLALASHGPLAAEAAASASGFLDTIWLLIAIPLASAAVLLLLGRRADRWGHLLGCASVAGCVRARVALLPAAGRPAGRSFGQRDDLPVLPGRAACTVDFGLLLDPLSAVFVLLITGVGFLIHVYAVGYMADDPGRRKFFGYFNLFVAAMLMLVLGNNYVMLYLGWEGVGLASYLLIAFWYGRPSAATAGKKAFIMNRVGDAGLAIAIFIMFATIGTVDYDGGLRRPRPTLQHHHAGAGPAAADRRRRQVGPVPAAGVVARRHGRPDAGVGPDPRRDDGHRRCLPDRPVQPHLRRERDRAGGRGRRSARSRCVIGCIIGCAKDDIKRVLAWSTVVPDRLHVPRRRPRRRRLRAGHHPPAGPRLLQGRAVPRRRLGHARHERPGRHPALRWHLATT